MKLKMFESLLPYYGCKRKLCQMIFGLINKYLPRAEWQGSVFVDAFMGSAAMSLYAKSQGFKVIGNDIAERSYLAGQALIENNGILLTDADIHRLFIPREENKHLIEKRFMPDVFIRRHAVFLDNAFANAVKALHKYLLIKYIFHIRPYSKFSSPNAFNKPMAEERFDEIKHSYIKHIKDNFKTPLSILKNEMEQVNRGIFSNGLKNEVYKMDVFDFIKEASGDVLYLDPPYSGTLSYEGEYRVIDEILGDVKVKSGFSKRNGMDILDGLLQEADKFPLWVISFGNANGKNDLNKLVDLVNQYRKCDAKEFEYEHCRSMATKEHKRQCREWLVAAWK
jgi:adenine-specific DNA-methyltransferase